MWILTLTVKTVSTSDRGSSAKKKRLFLIRDNRGLKEKGRATPRSIHPGNPVIGVGQQHKLARVLNKNGKKKKKKRGGRLQGKEKGFRGDGRLGPPVSARI